MKHNTIHFSEGSVGRLPGRNLLIVSLIMLLLLAFAGVVLAQEGKVPSEPPDASAGLERYADRCANCHGVTGQGDGELAADLPNPPAAHSSESYLRESVPSTMFDVITNGRVEKGMPPFGPDSSEPLSEEDRWDLIAAVYSFGTPVETVQAGQSIYEENCLECHGENGVGNGPRAGDLTTELPDLTNLDYWFTTSNQAVFDTLNAVDLPEHDYDIDDDDLWSVTDYIRTFSYGYTDALAPFRPLEKATISGLVTNGTTGEPVTVASTPTLRAFTRDLNVTLELTTTLEVDGTYTFELTDVPQDWFFRVSLNYNGVDFGSDFGQLTFDEPMLEMPITVYDQSSDPEAITIERLHLVLGFDGQQVLVSEVYIVSNNDPTVFVGETGELDQGTFEIFVPDGAQDVTFQRGYGSIDSFIPASEVIKTESGWADTLPLRPGPGTLTLVVLYSLPYEDSGTISHPIAYDTGGINLVIPDVGVTLEGDNWQSTGTQSMEAGQVNAYSQIGLTAGSEVIVRMEGEPGLPATASTTALRDNSTELLVGVGIAVAVLIVAGVFIRQWRQVPEPQLSREELLQELAMLDDEFDELSNSIEEELEMEEESTSDDEELLDLGAISTEGDEELDFDETSASDADDEFEAGEIDQATYTEEREEIKAELLEIWENDITE